MQRGEAVATAGLGEKDPGRQAISEGEAESGRPLSRLAELRVEGMADAGSWRRGGAPHCRPATGRIFPAWTPPWPRCRHLVDLPRLDTS